MLTSFRKIRGLAHFGHIFAIIKQIEYRVTYEIFTSKSRRTLFIKG